MRSKARKLLHALEGDCECNSHLVLLFEERHSSDLVSCKILISLVQAKNEKQNQLAFQDMSCLL